MVDMCKCDGKRCPQKETCYRYTAPADPLYQVFFVESPLDENNCCRYYICTHNPPKIISVKEINSLIKKPQKGTADK